MRPAPVLIRLNKPYDVLCQFSRQDGRATLADYVDVPRVYPCGRLDRDSEGLVLLTDHGPLQHRIAHPRWKLPKTYWVQVERIPDAAALASLREGVLLDAERTDPARVRLIAEPAELWPRTPPVRFRKTVPSAWLELSIAQGRNRQVRRMCAAVGHPCLRLIRTRIGPITLAGLAPGAWQRIPADSIPTGDGAGRRRR